MKAENREVLRLVVLAIKDNPPALPGVKIAYGEGKEDKKKSPS